MHIFFSGIGGAGTGPLAQIALEAGYTVSGSDKQSSGYIDYLKNHGIIDIHIGQDRAEIEKLHNEHPIDWFVYSSALTLENPDAPELIFCHEQGIRVSKRDQLIKHFVKDKGLNLVAIAGTHGKTSTTAMTVWLYTQLGIPISYLLPAKTSFADMGKYDAESKYFIYEADEFDRNFLAYEPAVSLITGVTWDHHEIFPTREDYQAAFNEFISQSDKTFIWEEDADYLKIPDSSEEIEILSSGNKIIESIKIKGKYNRLDAYLALSAVAEVTETPLEKLVGLMDSFPGLSRRMEEIKPGLFSDYAHTPEKIRGGMSVAMELAEESGKDLVIIYEPLTNRRQHYMLDEYKDCFDGAKKVYWTPSYLAREDKRQRIIPPEELISHLNNAEIAEAAQLNETLKENIQNHLDAGDMVVGMAGGGGGSLDDWLRKEFQ